MAKLHELIFESDLFKLNEEYIGQIVKECALPKPSESEEFSGSALWMALTSGSLKQQVAIAQKLKAYVFAGKTAVVWYWFDQARENLLTNALNLEVFLPDLHKLVAKEPVLVGGVQLEDGNYLLRFMVKTGTNRRICGTGVTAEPKTALITALVSTAGNYIEVRCEAKLADKIIGHLREKYVRDPKAIVKVDRYSDDDINRLVRDLDGKLIEASSHPEILVNDMKPKHVEAVSEVLEAIDLYFHTADSQGLMAKLENVRKICGTTSAVPFVVLVLAGMDKISMGTKKEKDLRNQALYKILQPYVRQLGGFITFPVVENRMAKEYTIRIGATTKSIGFATNATEKVIEAVRNKLLDLEEEKGDFLDGQ